MRLLDTVSTLPTIAQPIQLVPLGCIHADADGFNRHFFEGAVDYIASTPYCFGLGLGDYFDFARSAYRRHLQAYQGDTDSRKTIDKHVRERTLEFARKSLRPIRKRLLGLGLGNHHFEFADGTNDTQLLCHELDVPYLEVGAWIRWHLQHGKRQGESIRTLKVFVHHGNWGKGTGGRTKGASRNAADQRGMGRLADIVLFAHDHKPDAWVDAWQTIPTRGALFLKDFDRLFARAGTFAVGEIAGCVTYVEREVLRPERIGYPILKIKLTQRFNTEARRSVQGATSGVGRAPQLSYGHEIVHP